MKKLIMLLPLLLAFSILYSQDTTVNRPLSKQDYLNKSKGQRTAAWILLGTGTALIAIAAPGDVSFDILPVLVVGGGAAIVGSIPLFISAGKNKRRAEAMTAGLIIQQAPAYRYVGLSKPSFPAVAIKFSF